eukprot:Platyproteum_vivax@DN5654_c0_g1_i1.p1
MESEKVSPTEFKLNPEAKVFTPKEYPSQAACLSPKELTSQAVCLSPTFSKSPNRASKVPDGAVLVIKNLPFNITEEKVVSWLLDLNLTTLCVTRHIDARSGFKGTVFVSFSTKSEAMHALEVLGSSRDFQGRRVKIEFRRKGRELKTSESNQTDEELQVVTKMIENFVESDLTETFLPADLSVSMRKYAHSLAEKCGLVHVTTGETSPNGGASLNPLSPNTGRFRAPLLSPKSFASPRQLLSPTSREVKQVYLSKYRPSPGQGRRKNKERWCGTPKCESPCLSPLSFNIPLRSERLSPDTTEFNPAEVRECPDAYWNQPEMLSPYLQSLSYGVFQPPMFPDKLTRWHAHSVSPMNVKLHYNQKVFMSPAATRDIGPPPGFDFNTLPPRPARTPMDASTEEDLTSRFQILYWEKERAYR